MIKLLELLDPLVQGLVEEVSFDSEYLNMLKSSENKVENKWIMHPVLRKSA